MKNIITQLAIPTCTFGAMILQQKIRDHAQKGMSYKRLMQSVRAQLKLTQNKDYSIEQLVNTQVTELLQSHQSNLKQKTVKSLKGVKQFKSQNHTMEHLASAGLFVLGFVFFPRVFSYAIYGYIAIYQYCIFGEILKYKINTQLPAFNYKSFHYFYSLGCATLFLGLLAGKGFNQIRKISVSKTKDLMKRN